MHFQGQVNQSPSDQSSRKDKLGLRTTSATFFTSLFNVCRPAKFAGAWHIALVLILFFPIQNWGLDQDSLAYIFRQDNLSTNNDLQLNYKFGFPKSDLLINDALNYKVFSYDRNTTEGEQYSLEHRLRSDYTWGKNRNRSIRLESSQHRDHRTGLATNIRNWALLAGVKRSDNLELFLGGRSVERYGILDEGWATELEFREEWKSQLQRSAIVFSGTRDQLAEHLNHSMFTRADYQIRFGDISTFQSFLTSEKRTQAFYTDSLGSSQSRTNDKLDWQNRFVYALRKDLQFFYQLNWGNQLTEISQEKVDQTATIKLSGEDRKRLSLLNETGLELTRPHFSTLTAFKVENSQNKYYVDYTQILYQVREELQWLNSGLFDSLSWKTMLSRLEYDTPDTTNDDDRDELRLNTEVRFAWQPTPFYHFEIGAKLGMFHLIYLFNTRSSENHWNRNMVLWSGLDWNRGKWNGAGRARIRSNYFDYDFDDLFLEMEQPTRSFVHRSLDLRKELSYHLNRRWSLASKLTLSWEDEGQLDWSSFIQQVSSNREQVEFIVRLFYDYAGWKGWVGYLTHDRVTSYVMESRQDVHWEGQGPLLGVKYRLGNRIYVNGDARFISVRDQDREYVIPKVYLTLVYR